MQRMKNGYSKKEENDIVKKGKKRYNKIYNWKNTRIIWGDF